MLRRPPPCGGPDVSVLSAALPGAEAAVGGKPRRGSGQPCGHRVPAAQCAAGRFMRLVPSPMPEAPPMSGARSAAERRSGRKRPECGVSSTRGAPLLARGIADTRHHRPVPGVRPSPRRPGTHEFDGHPAGRRCQLIVRCLRKYSWLDRTPPDGTRTIQAESASTPGPVAFLLRSRKAYGK